MTTSLTKLGPVIASGALTLVLVTACGASLPAQSQPVELAEVPTYQMAELTVSSAREREDSAPPVQVQATEPIEHELLYGLNYGLFVPDFESEPPLAVPPPSLDGKAIVVDQALQMMGIFQDGVEIRRMPISTGRPTYGTYTRPWNSIVGRYVGTFQSYTGGKADNAWYLYDASGAILIHSAPYIEMGDVKEYYDLDALGEYPSSAGCVRLHPDDAQWLTDWGPQFAPFTITELPGPIEGLIQSG